MFLNYALGNWPKSQNILNLVPKYLESKKQNMSILEFAQKRRTEKMRAKTGQIRHCGNVIFFCAKISKEEKKAKKNMRQLGKVHFMSEKRQLLNASVRHTKFYLEQKKCFKIDIFVI